MINQEQLNTMYEWISKKMVINKWYPVKTRLAKQLFISLMDEDLIQNCEFNHDYSRIRKIDFEMKKIYHANCK